MLKEIITFLVSSTLISGIIVFLGQKIIESYFSKELEKYKSDLEKENQTHRIKFEKLHTERADIIKAVYQKLVDANNKISALVNPMQWIGELSDEEKSAIVFESLKDLRIYFDINKIFFEPKIAKKLMDIQREFYNIVINFSHNKGDREKWGEVWGNINDQVRKVSEEIENDFREIIGIDTQIDNAK